MEIICTKCGKYAQKIQTSYGIRNHCCDLWSWGDAPLVDKQTHEARKAAHAAFDIIWKSGWLSRTQAYTWLAKTLGILPVECHIKLMDYKTAQRVINLCSNIKETYGERSLL